jgi:putative endonuclease
LSAFAIFAEMFYIYILYSPSADRFYVGHTENYLQRLTEHNNSERITYTSKHRPWLLKAVFVCGNNRGEAQKIELFIKKQEYFFIGCEIFI